MLRNDRIVTPIQNASRSIARFSVSLPRELALDLDDMVSRRSLPSRSRVIADLLHREISDFRANYQTSLAAGTITILYRERGTQRSRLAEIQAEYAKEVITSQHVFLEDNRSLEVLLVQGPAARLRKLRDRITSCRDVENVRLTLVDAVLPPLHERNSDTESP